MTLHEGISKNARMNGADILLEQGIEAGDRVPVMVDDRSEYFYAYLGAFKTGAVPVVLNLRFPCGNLTYIVENSTCKQENPW